MTARKFKGARGHTEGLLIPPHVAAQRLKIKRDAQALEAALKKLEKDAPNMDALYKGAKELGLSFGAVGKRYGVSRQRVNQALQGRDWLDQHNKRRVANRAKEGSRTSTCRACGETGHNARNPRCPRKAEA